MEQLLATLGLDTTILLSQLLNFLILYILLKKFALDKLLKAINQRQEMIANGVRNAQDAKLVLKQVKIQQEEIINDARAKARELLAEARKAGKEQGEKLVAIAEKKANQVLVDAREQIQTEKQKMLLEVKGELADIIATGMQKIADENIDQNEISRQYLRTNFKA